MEVLPTAISALVVAGVGLILARLASQRFDALEASLGRMEQRLDSRIDALDRKFDTKFDGLDAKFDKKVDSLRRSHADRAGCGCKVGSRVGLTAQCF